MGVTSKLANPLPVAVVFVARENTKAGEFFAGAIIAPIEHLPEDP